MIPAKSSHDLVDFAMRLPIGFKIKKNIVCINENDLLAKSKKRNMSGKVLLRKTLGKHLDEKITHGEKLGFSSPDASWFKGESIDYVKKETAKLDIFFDCSAVQKIVSQHLNNKKNRRLAIWSLLYLKKMKDIFYDSSF